MTENPPASVSDNLPFLRADHAGELPAHLAECDTPGMGNENVGAEDQTIPRLNLLQALSPQIEELDGAKAGLFHNSVTNELYTDVYVLNLFFKKEWAIFRERNKGGGFHGSYDSPESAHAHVATLPGDAADYGIQETAKHACLLLDPTTGEIKQPVVIYLKSTGLTVSRNWNSKIDAEQKGHPRFSGVWHITALKKQKGEDRWYVLDPKFAGWASEELFNQAKDFYKAISSQV